MDQSRQLTTNKLLGYPDDARLLLVNADDLGMYQDINAAIVRAFDEGIVRSTSLMVPCPGASHAMELLKKNPGIRFGVHLSFIRDIDTYQWGPMSPKDKVPSLLDADGNLYTTERTSELLSRADVGELEIEFRAQIEAVFAAGLRPTHLDWHCLYNGGRPDIFELTLRLAQEYQLAVRADSRASADRLRNRGLPTVDHDLFDSFDLDLQNKGARYAELLRGLPLGLSAWAVHPGLGGPEARDVDPDGWQVRRTDLDFLVSPEARETIRQEGITLIDFGSLQAAWLTAD